MSWEPEFLALMPLTVYRSTATATNLHGARTYSTSVHSYRARVTGITAAQRGEHDQTAAPQAVVWVASTGTGLSVNDKWRLPSGVLSSSVPPILRADCVMDEDGPHHWKLTAGW